MGTPRQNPPVHNGWTSEVSSGFALAGFLALVFVGFTLLAVGPLLKFDAYFSLAQPPRRWLPFLYVLDRVGQRAVCLPVLGLAAFLICRRASTWRPAVVAAASIFALNLVVLMLKIALGRGTPEAADPSFFSGGMAYPSGHSANIVLAYGLVPYLLSRYCSPSRKALSALWSGVAILAVTMLVTSLTLNWHWFADLVAGLLVGAIVLQATASVDRAVPRPAFARSPEVSLPGLRRALRTRRSSRSDGPT